MNNATEEIRSVVTNVFNRTMEHLQRGNATKMAKLSAFQAGSPVMENAMRGCSNVDKDVFLTIIAISMAIEIVETNALEDKVHAMENVDLGISFVQIAAGW